jgi:hypothetical protein
MSDLQLAVAIIGGSWAGLLLIGAVYWAGVARQAKRMEAKLDTTGGNQDGHPDGHSEQRAARAGGVDNRAA